MATSTTTYCDFCNAKQLPTDVERWGVLIIGRQEKGPAVRGVARDVCPVCIARLRQVAGAA